MRHYQRTCFQIVAVIALMVSAPSVWALELNPANWVPSETSKAEKRAEKAEQEASDARRRAEAAQREAEALKQSAEQARLEAEAKEQIKSSRRNREQTPQKQEESQTQVSETSTQTNTRDVVNDITPSDKPVEKAEKKTGASVWNPISWFSTSDPNAKQTASAENKKDKAQAMLLHENEERAADTLKKQASTALPEGIKESDARYYEEAKKMRAAVIETQHGNITVELYPEAAPVTVTNFVKLTEQGFYNQTGMNFHRVVPGFVVQTGDPTGTGAGGSRDRIPLEVKNRLSHDGKGVLAMARGQTPNSATSQFYLTLAPQKTLDAKYAIFGRAINGFAVLDKIEKGDRLYGVKLVDLRTVTKEDPNEGSKQSLLKKIF